MSGTEGPADLFDDPREALVFAHAAGALDPATSLLVAAHAALSPRAAGRLRAYEAAGGALLETEIAPVAVASDALAACLARIDAPSPGRPPQPSRAASFAREIADLPAVVRAAVARAPARDWRFLGPGVKAFDLPAASAGGPQAQLLRIQPGSGAPRHTHGGVELTLCLKGAFRDERGRYDPGDIAIATPELTHRPIAEPGPVCIALAVTDAPLVFTGVLGFLQRALRGGPG